MVEELTGPKIPACGLKAGLAQADTDCARL